MPSQKFTTATPWLRDASAYTRTVFTIQVDVERQGTQITKTMRVIDEVQEIALVPSHLNEGSDRGSDQDAALEFLESLPNDVEGSTLRAADEVANDQEGSDGRTENETGFCANGAVGAVPDDASDTATMSSGTIAGGHVDHEDGASDTATMSSGTIAGDLVDGQDGASDSAASSSNANA